MTNRLFLIIAIPNTTTLPIIQGVIVREDAIKAKQAFKDIYHIETSYTINIVFIDDIPNIAELKESFTAIDYSSYVDKQLQHAGYKIGPTLHDKINTITRYLKDIYKWIDNIHFREQRGTYKYAFANSFDYEVINHNSITLNWKSDIKTDRSFELLYQEALAYYNRHQ